MKRKKKSAFKAKTYLYAAALLGAFICGMVYYYLFSSFSHSTESHFVYIDDDDTQDSVFAKLQPYASRHGMSGFTAMARHSSMNDKVRTGRYEVAPGESAFSLFRRMKNGVQTPLNLTIPEVRTIDRLAAVLGKKMMADSAQLMAAFTDSAVIASWGYTHQTLPALFVPNTYSIYWNSTPKALLERMAKEHARFWEADARKERAAAMQLSETEVATLASIIDEETANNAEKPMIAGMYLNRLRLRNAEYPEGMPLQADPTVKFACGDFSLKRIYHKLLFIDSPYNTYINPGLPPGPIKIASVAGIDAVLHYVEHDYLYMCAKEDFSGTHNFAKTYPEHLLNAAKYTAALNRRGIK